MLRDLIRVGKLPVGAILTCSIKGVSLRAVVTFDGLVVEGGGPCEYGHLSPAASKPGATVSANGWYRWRLPDGRWLADLRDEYRRGEY